MHTTRVRRRDRLATAAAFTAGESIPFVVPFGSAALELASRRAGSWRGR
jgi:hypothetical protein